MATMMKRTLLAALLATLAALPSAAQEAGRIHRTEVIPYDTRQRADARTREGVEGYIAFAPRTLVASDGASIVGQEIEIPYAWTDGLTYLHLEHIGSAYSLWVNDMQVAEVDDCATPAEFAISDYVRQGTNSFRLLLRPSATPAIDPAPAKRTPFLNCYLYNQNKRSIRDFEIALVPDSAGRDFGVLKLAVVAQNGFNYDEQVEVGYDIYSPQGKLLEFNIREVTIPGRSTDTVRFSPYIYHTFDNKWEAGGAKNPPLYRVMLFTRRNGTYREYMPLKIGFGRTEWVDGKLMRLGREIRMERARYNAAADRKTTQAEIRALKAQGKNTLCPDYPQPEWFYELCDEAGMYVVDCAAVSAPERRDDRRTGGTPSNDPALADEYLERVRAMYYRSRNHTCVVAYALGAPSGNGYCMYKAYEWLKSVEKYRPVVYVDADGEWNSDL